MEGIQVCGKCGKSFPRDTFKIACPFCLAKIDQSEDKNDGTGPLRPTFVENRYAFLEEHARGGMGRILRVYDHHIGREIALKELVPPDKKEGQKRQTVDQAVFAKRFLEEAQITGQLEHPGIVPVYDLGHHEDGTPYYTMKFVRGQTLYSAINNAPSFKDRLVLLSPFINLCQALAYAHSRGIIHRDIKTSNVMLGEFGETIIIDWGLAKKQGDKGSDEEEFEQKGSSSGSEDIYFSDKPGTAWGQVLGTPACISPEQAQGHTNEIDHRSDIYGLGAVLYEILTTYPPFSGTTSKEIISKVIHDAPLPIRTLAPDVPKALAAICEKAMHKDPNQRYQSAKNLANDILRFQSGQIVKAHTYTFNELFSRLIMRYRPYTHITFVAILLILLLSIFSYIQVRKQRNQAILAKAGETRAREAEIIARHQAEEALEAEEMGHYILNMRAIPTLLREGRIDVALEILWKTSETHRNWEWGYFLRECRQDKYTLEGQHVPAISPDGTLLATADRNYCVTLWNFTTGDPITKLLGHEGSVSSIAFDESGRFLVTASSDETVRIWQVKTGTSYRVFGPTGKQLTGARFTLDGQHIIAFANDNTARIWNIETQLELYSFPSAIVNPSTLAIHPNNSRLTMGCLNATARICNLYTGETAFELVGTSNLLSGIAFSSDGRFLVTNSGIEHCIEAWDATTGRHLNVIGNMKPSRPNQELRFIPSLDELGPATRDLTTGDPLFLIHQNGICPVPIFRPGINHVLVAAQDGRMNLYEIPSGKLVSRIGDTGDRITCASFSSDGKQIATGSQNRVIAVWKADSGVNRARFYGHISTVNHVFFSPDNYSLISDGGNVKVWDLNTIKEEKEDALALSYYSWGTKAFFSPDGQIVVAAELGGKYIAADLQNNFQCNMLSNQPFSNMHVAACSVNRTLATTCGTMATIWDIETGKQLGILTGHTGIIRAIGWSTDGNWLATAADDQTLRLWNTHTKQQIATAKNVPFRICALCFSPEGTFLATGDTNGYVYLYSLPSLTARKTSLPFTGFVNEIRISPDGKLLFVAIGQDIFALDSTLEKPITHFVGHQSEITSFALSTDGMRLATTTEDGSIKLYLVQTGEEVATIENTPKRVIALAFQKDEHILIGITHDLHLIRLKADPWTKEALPGNSGRPWQERYQQYAANRCFYENRSLSSGSCRYKTIVASEELVFITLSQLVEFLSTTEDETKLGTLSPDDTPLSIFYDLGFDENSQIISLNDRTWKDGREFTEAVSFFRSDLENRPEMARMEYLANGTPTQITWKVQPLQITEKEISVPLSIAQQFFPEGIAMIKRDPHLLTFAYDLHRKPYGVRIIGIQDQFQQFLYAQMNLAEDDVVVQIDQKPMRTPEELMAILDDLGARIAEGTATHSEVEALRGQFDKIIIRFVRSDLPED